MSRSYYSIDRKNVLCNKTENPLEIEVETGSHMGRKVYFVFSCNNLQRPDRETYKCSKLDKQCPYINRDLVKQDFFNE